MRYAELHKALHKSPFESFRIQLTGGESWLIEHPDFAGLTRTRVLVFSSSHDDGIPDTFNQYDLVHVVGIEADNGKGNDRQTKRKKRRR